MVDVRDYLWRLPVNKSAELGYIGIRYAEQYASPVPVAPPACGCKETEYKPSRIRDGFQIDVLWSLSQEKQEEDFDLCVEGLAPCPECPDSPYLILASIDLKDISEGDPITANLIDNWT